MVSSVTNSCLYFFCFFRYAMQSPLLVFWMLLLSSQISISIAWWSCILKCKMWPFILANTPAVLTFEFLSSLECWIHTLSLVCIIITLEYWWSKTMYWSCSAGCCAWEQFMVYCWGFSAPGNLELILSIRGRAIGLDSLIRLQ